MAIKDSKIILPNDSGLETVCSKFKRAISNSSLKEFHDVNYSRIFKESNLVITVTSKYEWHIYYWQADVFCNLKKRLNGGIHRWSSLLAESKKAPLQAQEKYDFVTESKTSYDILSIGSPQRLGNQQVIDLCEIRPKLALYASNLWNEHSLGMIQYPSLDLDQDLEPETEPTARLTFEHCDQYLFDNVSFTEIEYQMIRLILQLYQRKEIAYKLNLTEKKSRMILTKIKKRFGDGCMTDHSLFVQLRNSGVVMSCMQELITFR